MKFVGLRPVVVHGGGPQIGATLKRIGKDTRFVRGMRVTDEETMEIVEMVLAGKLNKDLVQLINSQGGRAIGLSGKDGNLIEARKMVLGEGEGAGEDLGFVGEVAGVNARIIRDMDRGMYVPVVAPIGVGKDGKTYNINADLVASRLAVSTSISRDSAIASSITTPAHSVQGKTKKRTQAGLVVGDLGGPPRGGWHRTPTPARRRPCRA